MEWSQLFAIWALTYAAAITTIRNLWGQEAVDQWTIVVLWALALVFVIPQWVKRRKAVAKS